MSAILAIESLSIAYQTEKGLLRAVDNVDLRIEDREIVCLVGESGSGKTTVANPILRSLPPNAIILDGRVLFEGVDLLNMEEEDMSKIRGRKINIVPQNPSTALNPILNIETQFCEFLKHKKGIRERDRCREIAIDLLGRVGIADPERVLKLYPHQLSGGMKQRVLIAIAISTSPRLLVADEPTSMLDATIQSQILDLLLDINRREGLSMLLITHDLGVAMSACNRIYVMYAGEIVESGSTERVISKPLHPYTIALIDNAFLSFKSQGIKRAVSGEPPNLIDLPSGCRFSSRCPMAFDKCVKERPNLVQRGIDSVRCFLYHDASA